MPEKRNSLPARHELKYFINHTELLALRARLRPVLALDAHCVDGMPYTVRSLYFDDVDNSAYMDKVNGVMERDKYRIRVYHLNGASAHRGNMPSPEMEIFLERKRKMGELIQKSSVRISRALAEQLIAGEARGLQNIQNELVRDVYVQLRTRLLRPAVIVDYEREAYWHPAQDVRITFDTKLRTALHNRALFVPRIPTLSPLDAAGVEILEVKFDNFLPDYIRALLSGVQADRSAVSKYVLCRRFEPLCR